MNQNNSNETKATDFSSLADYLTNQPQITEFVESVTLVASSIYGLFSNRSLSETGQQLLQTNTSSDVSMNILYALHKKLNCNDFLSYLERADQNGFNNISPDFFNPITKHFSRSQSIENFSKLLFNLCRIYGLQSIFFRNFFGISRDCHETRLLVKYVEAWDYEKVKETKSQITQRVLLSAFDRMANSLQFEEFIDLLSDFERVTQVETNQEVLILFNKLVFHFSVALIGKKNRPQTRELLTKLFTSGVEISLMTLNKTLDNLNKHALDIETVEFLFDMIQKKGLKPNVITYNCYLESYILSGNLAKAKEVFGLFAINGVQSDSYTYATLIKGCRYFGQESVLEFHRFILSSYLSSGCRDRLVFNSLIDECINSGDDTLVIELFDSLENGSIGIEADSVTYNIMLKLAIKNRDIPLGRRLVDGFINLGFRPNLSTYNSLLNICIKAHLANDALHFYEKLKLTTAQPDGFTFSIMLNGARVLQFDIETIKKILEDVKMTFLENLQKLDEVVFNTILEILFTYDLLDQFDFFHTEMKKQNIPESSFTFSVILKKLSKMEDFDKICDLIDEIMEKKIAISDFNYGFILDYFAKSKKMDWAYSLYKKLRVGKVELSSIIFTTMIKGFINLGDFEQAMILFNEIKHLTEQPGMIITYNCALDVLVHQEKIDQAVELFETIESKFKADLISYSTIVKGLCKAHRRQKATSLIKSMLESKIEYDVSIINLFLESCASSDDHKTGISCYEYFSKKLIPINEITLGIMVKIYGAQFKLKSAFELLDKFEECKIKPSLIFFTNLIHVSFYNKKPAKAELVFTLMRKENVKGDKLMYSKLIEGLLRFKQTRQVLEYVQAAIDDQCTLKPELITQLLEIYEDDADACQLIEKVRHSDRKMEEVLENKNRLKNNYHQINTQNFKNQIWQQRREKHEDEKKQQAQEVECRVSENPSRRGFGVGENGKVEAVNKMDGANKNGTSFKLPAQFGPKQPMVLHNFRANKKSE